MTAETLMQRLVNGDASAFDPLVEALQAPLIAYATRLTGSPETAQDVVQETFLKLVRNTTRIRATEQSLAWLYRVCRNLCADHTRKEARMQRRQAHVAVPELIPPETPAFEQEERDRTVRSIVGQLPEPDREVLLLKVQQGQSYRQIATITGLSLHSVGSAIHRGLRQVARELAAAGLI